MIKENIELRHLEDSLFGVHITPVTIETVVNFQHEKVAGPHRHDHYLCFFLESGYVSGNVDFQNLEVQIPSLFLVLPGQVHEFNHAKEITGWVMAFDARFVDQNARMAIEQSFAKIALIKLNETETKWFANIFQLIHLAVNEANTTKFQQPFIQTLISAFFYKTVIIFHLQEDERIQAYSSRSIEIAKKFHQLVKENFLVLKKPGEYASRLSVTVSYLNDTVKSVTGFSSTWFIHHEIFREAQRLLFYTDKSVKEIAFQLGYEDYKYFIRLFSKTVGISPANFRKNNKHHDFNP